MLYPWPKRNKQFITKLVKEHIKKKDLICLNSDLAYQHMHLVATWDKILEKLHSFTDFLPPNLFQNWFKQSQNEKGYTCFLASVIQS